MQARLVTNTQVGQFATSTPGSPREKSSKSGKES
jgi:hypothetical protein